MTSPPPTSGPPGAGPSARRARRSTPRRSPSPPSCATPSSALPTSRPPTRPTGSREADNQVIRIEGFDGPDAYGPHQRVPHWDIGAELGILDLEAGARLSGSMFPLYRGEGARLVRALCQLALDLNRDAYEEIRPPTLVRTETMVSTGHLPKFEDDAYHLERDDLWAIPTAEVPLTSLGRDHVYDEADLPVRLMAHTSCFRREAGSAGRDTRGLLRVHEFDKVEILAYATEAQAADVHADILRRAEAALTAARPRLPGARPVRRRPGRLVGPHLRPRGLRPRLRHVAGGVVGVVVLRLPGPAGQHPLPARRFGDGAAPAPAPSWPTPSTAPPWPSPGCGRRWWRPTASRTGRSPSPPPSSPTSAAPPTISARPS